MWHGIAVTEGLECMQINLSDAGSRQLLLHRGTLYIFLKVFTDSPKLIGACVHPSFGFGAPIPVDAPGLAPAGLGC